MTVPADRGQVLFVSPAPRWRGYLPWMGVALVLHAALLWMCSRWRGPAQAADVPPLRVIIASVLPGSAGEPSGARPVRPPLEEPRAAPPVVPEPPKVGDMNRKSPKPKRPPRVATRPKREAPPAAGPLPAPSDHADAEMPGANESNATLPLEATGRGVGEGSGGGAGHGAAGSGGANGAGLGDARAYCIRCPAPAYPPVARQRNWSGVVAVRLELRADGTVQTARVERSSGYDVLDREAVEAARRSRFRVPPTSAGRGIEGTIEYRFELVP